MPSNKYFLGDLITQRREKNPGGNLPIRGVSKDGLQPPKQIDADTRIYNLYYRNDFIFNPARMELGSIAFNDEYDMAICSSLYEVFYVHRTDLVIPEFLALFVKHSEFSRFCNYLGNGSAREYCRFDDISRITIVLPPLQVQHKIVRDYKIIKDRIKILHKINSNLETQACTIIARTIGIPILINKNNAEIDKISKQHTICTIKDYCTNMSTGATPSRIRMDFWTDGSIPWLKSGEVHNCCVFEVEEYITKKALEFTSVKMQKSGTVVIAMYGATAAQVGFLCIDTTTNQAICALECSSFEKAAYLYFSLILSQREIFSQANGGAQDNLSKEMIEKFNIIVPSKEKLKSMGLHKVLNLIKSNTGELVRLEKLSELIIATMQKGE